MNNYEDDAGIDPVCRNLPVASANVVRGEGPTALEASLFGRGYDEEDSFDPQSQLWGLRGLQGSGGSRWAEAVNKSPAPWSSGG